MAFGVEYDVFSLPGAWTFPLSPGNDLDMKFIKYLTETGLLNFNFKYKALASIPSVALPKL